MTGAATCDARAWRAPAWRGRRPGRSTRSTRTWSVAGHRPARAVRPADGADRRRSQPWLIGAGAGRAGRGGCAAGHPRAWSGGCWACCSPWPGGVGGRARSPAGRARRRRGRGRGAFWPVACALGGADHRWAASRHSHVTRIGSTMWSRPCLQGGPDSLRRAGRDLPGRHPVGCASRRSAGDGDHREPGADPARTVRRCTVGLLRLRGRHGHGDLRAPHGVDADSRLRRTSAAGCGHRGRLRTRRRRSRRPVTRPPRCSPRSPRAETVARGPLLMTAGRRLAGTLILGVAGAASRRTRSPGRGRSR